MHVMRHVHLEFYLLTYKIKVCRGDSVIIEFKNLYIGVGLIGSGWLECSGRFYINLRRGLVYRVSRKVIHYVDTSINRGLTRDFRILSHTKFPSAARPGTLDSKHKDHESTIQYFRELICRLHLLF